MSQRLPMLLAPWFRSTSDVSDADLVQRFAKTREEAAFAELMRRHGGMVLGVARRVLGEYHEAEDVAQAAFLLLARRVFRLQEVTNLAGWLHATTYHMALNERRARKRRQGRLERFAQTAQSGSEASPLGVTAFQELSQVLDQELLRLPEAFRSVFILCCLEGKSHQEVAVALGCPEGTISSRLARARAGLQKRLRQRGLAIPAGLGFGLAQGSLQAQLPKGFLSATLPLARQVSVGEMTCLPPTLFRLVQEASVMSAPRTLTVAVVLATTLLLGGLALYGRAQQKEDPLLVQESGAGTKIRAAPADPIEGPWRLQLRAGFTSEARFVGVEKNQYRLISATRFAGLYQLEESKLTKLPSPGERYEKYVWRLTSPTRIDLIDQPPTDRTGQDYLGTALTRPGGEAPGPKVSRAPDAIPVSRVAQYPPIQGKVVQMIGSSHGYAPPLAGDPFSFDFRTLDDRARIDMDTKKHRFIPLPATGLDLERLNTNNDGSFSSCRLVSGKPGDHRVKVDIIAKPGRGNPRFVEVWVTIENQGVVSGMVYLEGEAESDFPKIRGK